MGSRFKPKIRGQDEPQENARCLSRLPRLQPCQCPLPSFRLRTFTMDNRRRHRATNEPFKECGELSSRRRTVRRVSPSCLFQACLRSTKAARCRNGVSVPVKPRPAQSRPRSVAARTRLARILVRFHVHPLQRQRRSRRIAEDHVSFGSPERAAMSLSRAQSPKLLTSTKR